MDDKDSSLALSPHHTLQKCQPVMNTAQKNVIVNYRQLALNNHKALETNLSHLLTPMEW